MVVAHSHRIGPLEKGEQTRITVELSAECSAHHQRHVGSMRLRGWGKRVEGLRFAVASHLSECGDVSKLGRELLQCPPQFLLSKQ